MIEFIGNMGQETLLKRGKEFAEKYFQTTPTYVKKIFNVEKYLLVSEQKMSKRLHRNSYKLLYQERENEVWIDQPFVFI